MPVVNHLNNIARSQRAFAVGMSAVVVALIGTHGTTFADDSSAGRPESLASFVQQAWQIDGFQLGRDAVNSTVLMRVSTYMSPAFIHRGQMEGVGLKAKELSELCSRQGGEWAYLGLPPARNEKGQPLASGSSLAGAAASAPATEAGMRDFVKAGEKGVAADVAKAFIAALQQAPDALVAEAIENAVRWKWLGRFECRRDAAPWIATISLSKWAARTEKSYVYRDVTLKVELTQR